MILPVSGFALLVTSCDEVFFGIRNKDVNVLEVPKGFAAIPGDGLVSLVAGFGGEVTVDFDDGVTPVVAGRERILFKSLVGGGADVGVEIVVTDEVGIEFEPFCSWPEYTLLR